MLPVSTLIEAPEHLLIRERKDAILKMEMIENPISDVQPILCIVSIGAGEHFDPKVKEGYVYETIGGNNSREALQQLMKDKPELCDNRLFTHRLCSVYSKMDTKLALRLASKHNRATNFSHDMTTWDKVTFLKVSSLSHFCKCITFVYDLQIVQCRKLLFEMVGRQYSDESEPPEKANGWKKMCAAVLSQKVSGLP